MSHILEPTLLLALPGPSASSRVLIRRDVPGARAEAERVYSASSSAVRAGAAPRHPFRPRRPSDLRAWRRDRRLFVLASRAAAANGVVGRTSPLVLEGGGCSTHSTGARRPARTAVHRSEPTPVHKELPGRRAEQPVPACSKRPTNTSFPSNVRSALPRASAAARSATSRARSGTAASLAAQARPEPRRGEAGAGARPQKRRRQLATYWESRVGRRAGRTGVRRRAPTPPRAATQ